MSDEHQQEHVAEQQLDESKPQYKRWTSRPQSTLAQNFALDLDSMFGLGAAEGVANLNMAVQEKKAILSSREQTLQELEAKLRETEERLAKVSRHSSPSRSAQQGGHADSSSSSPISPTSSSTVPTTTTTLLSDRKQAADGAPRSSPLGAHPPSYPADRPPTSRSDRPDHAASTTTTTDALLSSQTPQQYSSSNNSNNEYVMVDRNPSAGQAQRGYG